MNPPDSKEKDSKHVSIFLTETRTVLPTQISSPDLLGSQKPLERSSGNIPHSSLCIGTDGNSPMLEADSLVFWEQR
jgi:hypothetical protein